MGPDDSGRWTATKTGSKAVIPRRAELEGRLKTLDLGLEEPDKSEFFSAITGKYGGQTMSEYELVVMLIRVIDEFVWLKRLSPLHGTVLHLRFPNLIKLLVNDDSNFAQMAIDFYGEVLRAHRENGVMTNKILIRQL